MRIRERVKKTRLFLGDLSQITVRDSDQLRFKRICKENPIDNLPLFQLTTTIKFQVKIYLGFCYNTKDLLNNIWLLGLFNKEKNCY